MNNKKVFLINSLTSGGAERVLSILVNELKKQDYKIELICLEKNNFYDISQGIQVTYLSNSYGTDNSVKKLFQLPILALKLKNYLKLNNIYIVQSHVYRANYVNAISKLLGSKHNIQMVNAGQVSMYKLKGLIGKVNLFLIKKLYPFADKVICKSKGMEIDLQSYFKVELNTQIINNPYDVKKINYLKEELIEDFKFKENKKYLIYVGRFDSFKKPEYVIESLKYLDENIELILLGDGPRKEQLVSLSEHFNIENRVHFIGRVTNPYKYMARADVFILSSNDGEGFPNVLVEAMLCKTAVISTDCKSGPREILAPETDVKIQLTDKIELTDKGILIPLQNVKLMVKAINIILEDNILENKFVSNAYNRSLDFSLNTIVNKYKKVLEIE
ncbi:MAG: glycosyltransferase [Campylobacterota bacterium]|nr:glycosyltransferase [Campylobacterota bacterium]